MVTKRSTNLRRAIFATADLLDDRRTGPELSARHAFIAKVEDLCRKNYARPIGVAKMASVAKLSRSHFSRLFRQGSGIAPGQYLRGLRLAIALRLLQTGEYGVTDVANRCGFQDSSYFCRAFRKTFGITPGKVGVSPRRTQAAPRRKVSASRKRSR
jgi:AraC-like DNA-binding protein